MNAWKSAILFGAIALMLPGPALAKAHDAVSRFEVVGMVCESCARDIQEALGKQRGIRQVTVDLKTGRVTVVHRAHDISSAQIAKDISDYGFDVKPLPNGSRP